MADRIQQKIDQLKKELGLLEPTHADKAKKAASYALTAAKEARRKERSPKLMSEALKGLEASAAELETSHPNIAATIVEICRELTTLGI